jgi:hypothetical protein
VGIKNEEMEDSLQTQLAGEGQAKLNLQKSRSGGYSLHDICCRTVFGANMGRELPQKIS